jgi:hypothetical protein
VEECTVYYVKDFRWLFLYQLKELKSAQTIAEFIEEKSRDMAGLSQVYIERYVTEKFEDQLYGKYELTREQYDAANTEVVRYLSDCSYVTSHFEDNAERYQRLFQDEFSASFEGAALESLESLDNDEGYQAFSARYSAGGYKMGSYGHPEPNSLMEDD